MDREGIEGLAAKCRDEAAHYSVSGDEIDTMSMALDSAAEALEALAPEVAALRAFEAEVRRVYLGIASTNAVPEGGAGLAAALAAVSLARCGWS